MSAHIFIDADNIKPEIGFKAIEKFSSKYVIEQVDIIGNETTLSSKYLEASDIYNIKNCFYGKNSADTWLCTEIAKTIFEKPEVDTIIIVSSDRDFLAAIKLSTDQKRKVILVSDGNGHKNLKALLYDLRVNPDFIELVDFKIALELHEKKKSPVKKDEPQEFKIIPPEPVKKIEPQPVKKTESQQFKIIPPKSDADKIKDICRKCNNPSMQNFFKRNKANFKLLSVKYEGKTREVPFIDDMNFSTFTNILVELKVIPNGKVMQKFLDENSLIIVDKKISRIDETTEKISTAAVAKTPFDEVVDYFVSRAAVTKNIFIKCDGKLHEVPFINGITLEMFSKLLTGYGITDNANKVKEIIAESFLNLREDRIYFHSEEKISSDLKPYINKIPADTLNFIQQNEDKLKIVSIAHNNAIHKIPFVEGIPIGIFVHMLRHLQIIGKNANSPKILTANGFKIRDNLVFKNQ